MNSIACNNGIARRVELERLQRLQRLRTVEAEVRSAEALVRSMRGQGRVLRLSAAKQGTCCSFVTASKVEALAGDLMLVDFPLIHNGFASSPLIPMPSTPAKTAWFLAPETWKISYRPDVATSADVGVTTAMMKWYIATLQSWFKRWITAGSNPFIHTRLYSVSFPASVQIAYATLASYIHRTPANTETILQIVEDRSNALLHENGVALELNDGGEEWVAMDMDRGDRDKDIELDLVAQLARLHALITYQIIGLLDGDIRARYVAQGHIAVQERWAHTLLHAAARAFSSDNLDTVPIQPATSTYHSSSPQQDWHLWILAESIRRTWLVAMSLSRVFAALQQRWATCPGSIMYTNRAGLWDAESALEWEECVGLGGMALQRFECASLLGMGPGGVDEFGMAMLGMAVRGEVLEGWRVDGGR
ncbi:uncharacterized protein DSM5745_10710 [Aspergillus mulundensis]|uniref:Transcription factor domain-containing protein n=1 Tax=Aspergillus mulundensis TaxID=1810919 RepID=A0A3D8QHB1_9EURO|nr:Uncharacterized protein DSM5745_10710 [Aspergillus mulundensis]RDW61212.1 Uncharacterized protein DSM5745_10710 [Aspergillus mulundensis]